MGIAWQLVGYGDDLLWKHVREVVNVVAKVKCSGFFSKKKGVDNWVDNSQDAENQSSTCKYPPGWNF